MTHHLTHSRPLTSICGLLLLLMCVSVQADANAGRQALQKGQWTEAETEFKSAIAAEPGPAHLGLAELYFTTGRYPEALKEATEASLVPAANSPALCLAGEVHRETGKSAEAIKMFQAALAKDPRNLRARVYLGITYHETGQKPLAEKTLDLFFQDFNNGKIDTNKADQLTYTAMAARYLEAWQDANGTFQDAAEKDPNFLLANLEWGDLFLLKYRADEAAKCFGDVLKINKNHPRALIGMAQVRLEASYDVAAATKLADQALKTNPKYVPAFNLKAHMALDDERFAEAEDLLKQSLAINPVDLEAVTLLASSRYLQDDTAGYEAQRQKVLKQNPRFSDFYFLVGELAIRHHRYMDAVKLNRQAIALDPKNANALSALGTNMLRAGLTNDAEALKYLNQAFDIDGFNVRTFNTLQLYEEVIAKEYETVPGGIFTYRFNKKEKPLLARYVPPLMQRAWDIYVKKYGFTPKNPVAVELFTERQHYGARTIGLPELGAQGTCFGELITAMSPASAEASWELVLWHELAHVFHLQLSNNRVARWFTEGLAEYETNIVHPYWKREHAREIFFSLQRGDLWKISELSAAFTRPDRPNGVVIAYQQSSLVIHYLVDTYGFPKIVQALKLYGQGKKDAEVLTTITGKSLDALDTEFRDYLRKRYPHYDKGFLFDAGAYDVAKAKSGADAKPSDAAALATYAAALLARQPEEAQAQARKALATDPKNALARYVLAETLLRTKDPKGAKAEFEALVAQGTDGFSIRFALGKMAAEEGDIETAAKHLAEAKRWDPDRMEPYGLMMQLYEAKDRRDDLLKETEGYLDVNEHDHDAARLLIDRYAADKKWAEVARIAPRVIGITPMEVYVHQQYGLALATLNRPKEAIYELESTLLAGVRKPGPVRGLLAKQYLLTGDKVKAKSLAEQALKEDPGNPDATEVLAKVK
jgi:tetratricopeptide (TPR) repeat protein